MAFFMCAVELQFNSVSVLYAFKGHICVGQAK